MKQSNLPDRNLPPEIQNKQWRELQEKRKMHAKSLGFKSWGHLLDTRVKASLEEAQKNNSPVLNINLADLRNLKLAE
jgi:hypothetical protein